ncbi:MAG TPA: site-2 protease family protein [Frankiaceae bacterium]|nr:site-2 protease family protein [Frankiaceae bacterium]
MTDTIRLGRIAGVRVGVNWTVLAIFALLVYGLGAGRFPDVYPDRPAWAYAVAALVAGVVFFASLLAHEIAHAVVAKRFGLEVEGITLWLLGGVARIRGASPSPGAELRIAGVGPLVSALLAIGFGVVAFLLDLVGVTGLPLGVLAWLAGINLLLALFNVLPAAPLDGGRLLRAWLWRRHGDRLRATVTASRAGRTLGYVLVALGLLEFLLGGGFGGLWLALIGVFLVSAASAEEQQATLRGALTGLRARDVMSPDPTVVPEDVTVDVFLDRYVFAHRYSTFPVVDALGRPTGLVTLNRVKHVPAGQRPMVRLRDIACPLAEVPTIDPDDPVDDLLSRLTTCADGRSLVVRHGALVGIISPSDLSRAMDRIRLRGDPLHRV